ncbi:MAG: AAA family ATPase [Sphaerochaetaceae bacterium]|nr:AAA family ATPase [Sphaerochaetaceae bacterium]
MDLFEKASNSDLKNQPLAYRMRPRTLDEYIGQDHIVGPGRLLRRAIQADQLSSVIFYGPPGTGKTTLARVIANTTKSHFTSLNAVLSGVKELREEIEGARDRLNVYGRRTILFVDEVHRWNKSQQDALLPWVENGTFILIGATTENPFFEVNPALVSRSRIFQLKPLTDENLREIALQAVNDRERGYGKIKVEFEEGALEHLIDVAKGDARSLLNALELAVETSEKKDGVVSVSKATAEESIQRKAVLYDKEGDYHFDVISAFIKSLRGSDPDAALYWLAKMVHAGEDPRFIFRRMMISACEDVGLADPNAIVVVTSDAQAFNMIGMPEGRYHLTHAALYLATAPKSNSAMGFFDALSGVEHESQSSEVPNHLRDASRDSEGFGHGEGYMYPHAYRDHWVAQQYLPNELQGKVFYQPGKLGYEATIRDAVNRRREIQLETVDLDAFPENLTFTKKDKNREMWIKRSEQTRSQALSTLREKIFSDFDCIRSDRILVLNAGHGLMLWEAFRRTPEGLAAAVVSRDEDLQYINHHIETLEDKADKPQVFSSLDSIPSDYRFEHVLGRNVLVLCKNVDEYVKKIDSLCTEGSTLTLAETLPSEGSRLSDFLHMGPLQSTLMKAEKSIYDPAEKDRMLSGIERHFEIKNTEFFGFTEARIISEEDVKRWISASYAPALKLDELETQKMIKELTAQLCAAPVQWSVKTLIISATLSK